MKRGTQRMLAQKTGLSEGFISQFFHGLSRPSWTKAKQLGEATGKVCGVETDPVDWVEGRVDRIKAALAEAEHEVAA